MIHANRPTQRTHQVASEVSNGEQKDVPTVPFHPPGQQAGTSKDPKHDITFQEYHDAAAQYIDAVLKLAKLELNDKFPLANDSRDQVIDRAIELNSNRLVFHSAPVNHAAAQGIPIISVPSSAGTSASAVGTKGASSAQAVTARCSGRTLSGKQCKRTVRSYALTGQLGGFELFCHQHRTLLLEPTGFYAGDNNEWIVFDAWIPKYLHPNTQAALRAEMAKPLSPSDCPGYIYGFEIRDPTNNKLRLKVGRAVNVARRVWEWEKQCKTHEHVLRGFYPEPVQDGKSKPPSRLKGLIQVGEPASWCHRLERLVHLELADLATRSPYLERSGHDSASSRKAEVSASTSTSSNCIDCGKAHIEIFEFVRAKQGKLRNKEWELVVLPVIRKWGRFTANHL